MLPITFKLLNDDIKENHRKEICKSCENFTSLNTCAKCGCIMPLKWKFEEVKCPIDKW